MKRFLAMLLVLMLMVPACACGASYVEIDSLQDYGDCEVTVYFNNPFGGKTTFIAFHENYETEGSSPVIGQARKNDTSYTFYDLAPGETYTIYVMNETDTSTADSFDYTVSRASQYDSNNLRLYDVNLCHFRPDSVQGDYGYNYANDLSASKILSMLNDQNFMIKVDFRHSVYNQDFDRRALCVVKSPSGHVATAATTITIYKNCDGFWQTMMYMNDAFAEMYEANGYIPGGRYEVEIYVDGMLLGTDSFNIRNN